MSNPNACEIILGILRDQSKNFMTSDQMVRVLENDFNVPRKEGELIIDEMVKNNEIHAVKYSFRSPAGPRDFVILFSDWTHKISIV